MKKNPPLFGGVLIFLGILVAGFAAVNMARSVRLEESPFDQLDTEEQGFLPSVNLSADDDQAPLLPVAERDDENTEPEDTSELDQSLESLPETQQQSAGETPSPIPEYLPDRIVIPSIDLAAPVVEAGTREIEYLDESYEQWMAPNEFAAGWHTTSAPLGVTGNTVINGHHNVYGEVFKRLEELEVGDRIWVYSGNQVFIYETATRLILEERWQPVEVRLENARWLQTSSDERLTLVTCWPYESNTHRLIIAARPIRSYQVQERELDGIPSPDSTP